MNIYGFVPNYFLLQDPTIPIQVDGGSLRESPTFWETREILAKLNMREVSDQKCVGQ